MVPMEVAFEEEEASLLGQEQESRFYTCHVCGDNWLSLKEMNDQGEYTVTFIHQMGMSPQLKRVAHTQTPVLLQEGTVDDWNYFLDDEQVAEENWRAALNERRDILKSVCMN